MPSTKEIKTRIESVKQTQKITNAMYLIASTKLRKAKEELVTTLPYFGELKSEIRRIFRSVENVESQYFYPAQGELPANGKCACLVVTADKGLAGAYNQNVEKETLELLNIHPDTTLFVVGECGRQFFNSHNIEIEQSFLYTAQNPTFQRAREISSILLEGYEKGSWDRIYIVYTDMKNSLFTQAKWERLLPFHRDHFASTEAEKEITTPFDFTPSVEAVLDSVMHSYISGYIYSALIDSFCSEQNARMTAMDSANQNAQKLLDGLSLQYNRIRQAAITQEITEISAGAKAQRMKQERMRNR